MRVAAIRDRELRIVASKGLTKEFANELVSCSDTRILESSGRRGKCRFAGSHLEQRRRVLAPSRNGAYARAIAAVSDRAQKKTGRDGRCFRRPSLGQLLLAHKKLRGARDSADTTTAEPRFVTAF